MITALSPELLTQAKEEYARLRPSLEKKSPGQFIVIEPISKDYIIAKNLSDALRQAVSKYPDRQFYSIRIGSQSAVVFS